MLVLQCSLKLRVMSDLHEIMMCKHQPCYFNREFLAGLNL